MGAGSNAGGGGSSQGGSSQGGSSQGGSNQGGASTLGELLDEARFEELFPHRADPACSGELFTYAALIAAAAEFPTFASEGSLDARKRELAAFLANISHETTGGWPTAPDGPQAWGLCFREEVGCESGACTQYCDASNQQYPCAPGKTYHGRGPMQLSWNYNYGAAGDALGLPLLAEPERVANDGATAFLTALWFWQTPQAPKPSCHDVMTGAWQPSPADTAAGREPGFGMTVNIINGGIECGQPTPPQVADRIAFYERYCQVLGVDPGPALDCATMDHY
ncbi:MAG: glycoside hydrolase family 19 protein [Polyangiaceae bacterium]